MLRAPSPDAARYASTGTQTDRRAGPRWNDLLVAVVEAGCRSGLLASAGGVIDDRAVSHGCGDGRSRGGSDDGSREGSDDDSYCDDSYCDDSCHSSDAYTTESDGTAPCAGNPAGDAGGEPAGDAGGEPAGDAGGEPAGDAGAEPAGDAGAEPGGEPGPRRSGRLAGKRKAGGDPPAQAPHAKAPKNSAARGYDRLHARYYRGLSSKARAEIDAAEAAVLSCDVSAMVPARFRLLACGAPLSVKADVLHRCKPAFQPDAGGSERAKTCKWLDAFLRIPFGVIKPAPVSSADDPETVRRFIIDVRGRLNNKIYGHGDAKEQVVSTLAKWISNPRGKGNVIGIRGPMGCGKTTLVKHCIADALGLPMVSIALGGANDASVFAGHHVTYEGSTHGLVAGALMKAGCMNPVILFDELDKISGCDRGAEVTNILIHLTDATQNDSFQDLYFSNIPLDMSRAIMVFTYNSQEAINPILLDRMTCIETLGYSLKDKQAIAAEHLLPAACAEYGFAPEAITMSPEAVASVVARVAPEGGVRNLQRGINSIVSGLNMRRLIGEDRGGRVDVTQEVVQEFVKDATSSRNPSIDHLYT